MMTILISGGRTLRYTFEGGVVTKIAKRTLLHTEITDVISIAVICYTVVPTLRDTGLSSVLGIAAGWTDTHTSPC